MAHPFGNEWNLSLQPFEPHFLPTIPDYGGIGRIGHNPLPEGTPNDLFVEDAAAKRVHVIGVAVFRPHSRNNSFEFRNSFCCGLICSNRAIRYSPHPYIAIAPRLLRYPPYDGTSVGLFRKVIFVDNNPARFTRTANIDPNQREASRNQPCGRPVVAAPRPSSLGVAMIVENGPYRFCFRIFGQDDACGQFHAVGHFYPSIFYNSDLTLGRRHPHVCVGPGWSVPTANRGERSDRRDKFPPASSQSRHVHPLLRMPSFD